MENILYVALLGRNTLAVNTISTNLVMPADLGEPKAVKAWQLAFVHTLLMGGCREMKPVSAAVQQVLQV